MSPHLPGRRRNLTATFVICAPAQASLKDGISFFFSLPLCSWLNAPARPKSLPRHLRQLYLRLWVVNYPMLVLVGRIQVLLPRLEPIQK
jgi:hypothetical protein